MYLNHSKTKMYCILVFFNYHVLTRLWLCAYTESSYFKLSPSTLCLVTILVYQLSHVVYANGLHTSLLRHLRSRIPLGICLPVSLQRRLGYPNPPRSSTSCPRRGPHDPFQRLSQATSVVDVTEGVATLYMKWVFPRFGIPKKIISD